VNPYPLKCQKGFEKEDRTIRQGKEERKGLRKGDDGAMNRGEQGLGKDLKIGDLSDFQNSKKHTIRSRPWKP